MPKEPTIVCRKQVAGQLGISVSTTYRMQKRGELSPPKHISIGRRGWPCDDFEKLLQGLPTDPPPTGEER